MLKNLKSRFSALSILECVVAVAVLIVLITISAELQQLTRAKAQAVANSLEQANRSRRGLPLCREN